MSDALAETADLERRRDLMERRPPGRLIGPGHPVGDFLEAPGWELLDESDGFLRVRAVLPDRVRNPRGNLFGGFTATYVDFISLFAYWAGRERPTQGGWLNTLNLRIDYFEPVRGEFEMESRVLNRRASNAWVQTRFRSPGGDNLVLALATLRQLP